jgi:hypothetical protein
VLAALNRRSADGEGGDERRDSTAVRDDRDDAVTTIRDGVMTTIRDGVMTADRDGAQTTDSSRN